MVYVCDKRKYIKTVYKKRLYLNSTYSAVISSEFDPCYLEFSSYIIGNTRRFPIHFLQQNPNMRVENAL